MGERVHSRRGRHACREAQRQLRIREHRAWPEAAGEKIIFLMCVFSSEMTALRPTSLPVPAVVGSAIQMRDLPVDRTRAGLAVLVIEEIAGVARHERHGFGDIERGTAADADDQIRVVRAGKPRRRP